MAEADDGASSRGRSGAAAPSGPSQVEGIVVAIAPDLAAVHTACGDLLCTYRGRLRRPPRNAGTSTARRPIGRGVGGSQVAGRPATRNSGSAAPGLSDLNEATIVRVAVGERVLVTPLDATTGVVEELLPRHSVLARAAAGEKGTAQVMLANLDHAIIVLAVREPAPRFELLDRYLALCERARIDITICFNKVDLGIPPEVEAEAATYARLGYHLLWTSVMTGAHMDALRDRLRGRISLLTGPSGVGKSSQVNALLPEASQRVGAISPATGKGRHTTTGARLLPLPGGGWLADSAGIRELALWKVPAEELVRCFVELRELAGECAYDDCEHGPAEEGCALRAALAGGTISATRFASFERLLREARGEVRARV